MKKGPQRASGSVHGRSKRRRTRGRCGTLQRANFDKGKEKAHYRRLLSTNTNKKKENTLMKSSCLLVYLC